MLPTASLVITELVTLSLAGLEEMSADPADPGTAELPANLLLAVMVLLILGKIVTPLELTAIIASPTVPFDAVPDTLMETLLLELPSSLLKCVITVILANSLTELKTETLTPDLTLAEWIVNPAFAVMVLLTPLDVNNVIPDLSLVDGVPNSMPPLPTVILDPMLAELTAKMLTVVTVLSTVVRNVMMATTLMMMDALAARGTVVMESNKEMKIVTMVLLTVLLLLTDADQPLALDTDVVMA